MELRYGIENLSRHIPNIKHLISPVLDVAFKMQSERSDVNVKEVELSDIGIWKTAVSVNAYTEELRIEDDCTSTIIHVPKQQKYLKCNSFHFQFALDEKYNVAIHLKECTTIMFCAKLLMHRQTSNTKSTECKFVNFGCYGNRQLFNHIRRTFIRNDTE